MADSNNIGGKAIDSFFATWGRHPLSVFVIMMFLPLSFIFMLFHNTTITSDGIILMVFSAYGFASIVIIIVSFILYKKKHVLYNSLDMLSNHIEHQVHTLEESLENIKIGLLEEPYEDSLELLCPKSAQKPISEEACKNVNILEFLLDIQKDCGIYVPIKDETKLKLAKFYYKKQKLDKALEYINELKVISSEAHLYKGVILKKMKKEKKSLAEFEIARTDLESADCWICMLKVDSNSKDQIHDFIKIAETCQKSSLTKHCINKLSTAYYKNAKLFSNDRDVMAKNMNIALCLTNNAINNFESWAAYYNKACDLSVMANSELEIRSEKCIYDEQQTKYEIIVCLKKAFNERPALAVHSNTDVDLKWIKEKYPDEFYALLGKVYDKNNGILYAEG